MGEIFESTDPETIEHVLGGAYARMRIRPGRHGAMRMASTPVGPARLDEFRFTMDFDAGVEPLGALVFAHVTSGRIVLESDHEERRLVPGEVALVAQPEHPYTAAMRDMEIANAVLDPAGLSRVADTAPGRIQRPVRFTSYLPVSPEAAQMWRTTFTYVRDTADTAAALPGTDAFALVTASLERLLVATALTVFPNTALTDPTIEDRRDAHPDTLRRAIAFIEANPHRDITAADIAAAACVTIRAVQLAFRRHLGTTPMGYLRSVRMAHAHAELMAADRTRTTVTQIAGRWGFLSPSRFSAAYRQVYGRLPSQTLRR